MKRKFVCRQCRENKLSDGLCELILTKAKNLKYDRENWREALRLCPFDADREGVFQNKPGKADWVEVKFP